MQILPSVEIVNLGLYIVKLNSLVISDLHIGYEESLNRRGVMIPRLHFGDVVSSINYAFHLLQPLLKRSKKEKLDSIIVNGDLKHEFGAISAQEWREILKLLDIFAEHCKKIVLIKGNHDVMLAPVARKRNIEVVQDYSSNGFFICHGHKIPEKPEFRKAKTVIIGNEHPAVSIRDGPRTELFKCFLKGTFSGKKIVVLPSINPVTVGTDVLKEKFISPFLKNGINSYEVFVAADNAYYFGKVKDLK